MALELRAVTFDAGDADRLASFWAALMAWDKTLIRNEVCVRDPSDDTKPVLLFLPVPEGKTAKNRTHPDLHTDDVDGEVERAVALGATLTAWHAEASRWAVLQDPEGNEFCIVQPPTGG